MSNRGALPTWWEEEKEVEDFCWMLRQGVEVRVVCWKSDRQQSKMHGAIREYAEMGDSLSCEDLGNVTAHNVIPHIRNYNIPFNSEFPDCHGSVQWLQKLK